jgi:hypothetical protein
VGSGHSLDQYVIEMNGLMGERAFVNTLRCCFLFLFFLFLHFNVLMQPKAMKHSILSTYIDTHRVVLTMYVVWKSSLRETGS